MPGLWSALLARGSGPSQVLPRIAACAEGAPGPSTGLIASAKSRVRSCMIAPGASLAAGAAASCGAGAAGAAGAASANWAGSGAGGSSACAAWRGGGNTTLASLAKSISGEL
eukprot:13931539-Alexandrium_andersonii.AAC.1